ncbi:MAG: F0F1 ATP synthase subunit delta [Verrucomicrobia bacterium]|nr:F0F1 ATP synthase subunit delta [Verrucomicrobiota bacterium]
MKVSHEARRFARALFRASFTDGRLDEAKARQVVQQLVTSKPRLLVPILKTYKRLVRLEQERNTARVECAAELAGGLREQIVGQLQQVYRRPIVAWFSVNPALIGGVRVRIGDDVWDGSVAQRLRALGESL